MRKLIAAVFVGLTCLVTAAVAQEAVIDLSAQNARAHRATPGQSLTGPSQGVPGQIVANFLRSQGYSDQTVASLVTVSENTAPSSGMRYLRLEQEVGGLRVYGAYVKATINGQGELVDAVELLVAPSPSGLAPASINEQQALQVALNRYYPGLQANLGEAGRDGNTVQFSNNGFFYQDSTVTRVAVPLVGGAMRTGFLVETWSDQQNLLHHTLVSGSGQVLLTELRTNTDSYNIFPEDPDKTSQVVMTGPGSQGNVESPVGWLGGNQTTINISGNNVHAYLDSDANNAPDSGGTAVFDGNFLTDADPNQDPTTTSNKAVAVQNLFYLNNLIHDKLYQHGFNEAAGNFQEDNFGNGGAGSDSVNAEAQDGSGTSNANFSTPSDGSNPRMQMYLWTQSTPQRDGDVDSDVVYHEYGHGLTWRMIGGMSGPMSGAIGEGMSDVLSILFNNDDVVGEYSYNNPNGIRSAPYTGYSRTYGDFTGSSVHYDGEIYAAIIWKLWGLFQDDSISQDVLLNYLVGGMNSTPSGPAFEDMRDGILAEAQGDQSHYCLVWDAFASFGVGVGAKGSVKGGGPFGGGKVSVTESFDLPAECSGPAPLQITTTSLADGTVGVNYSYTLQASGGSGTRVWSVSSGGLPDGMFLDSSTGEIWGTPTTAEVQDFMVRVDDSSGYGEQSLTLTINAAPDPGAVPAAPSNLSASAKKKFIMLSWTDNSNNEDSFVLWRYVGQGGSWQEYDVLPADSSNYKDFNVTTGTVYGYKLQARNPSGDSADSNVAIATAQ